MADKPTATVQPASDTHTDYSIDIGDIMWPLFGIVVALLVFVLVTRKLFPGLRMRRGDTEVSVGGTEVYAGPDRRASGGCLDGVDVKALHVTQLVAKRRAESLNTAWAAQKAYADEVEDEFWPLLDRRGCDPWQVETAWSRMHLVLYNAADQNHVLEYITGDLIDSDYLSEKVILFRRRYEKLLARPGCTLPPFQTVEDEIRRVLTRALLRFARIAEEQEGQLVAFCEAMKATTDSDELKKIIDETAQRGTLEAA